MRSFAWLGPCVVSVCLAACGGRTPLDIPEDVPTAPDVPDGFTGCRSNADCAPGSFCDLTTHTCVMGCMDDTQCAAPTPHCRTDVHVCVACTDSAQCPAGEVCSGFQCVTTCMGGMCPPTETCCSNVCSSTSTDSNNCGGCGVVCSPFPNASQGPCNGAMCGLGRCESGFADCDGVLANGCETHLTSDPNHCGSCGNRCPAGDVCSGGICAPTTCSTTGCPAGLVCCSSGCANVSSDPANCGACGRACGAAPHATTACASGGCVITGCSAGFADCNGIEADGCETNVVDNNGACGSCGTSCASPAVCSGTTCVTRCGSGGMCSAGQVCCGASCADVQSDPNNCGRCSNVCPTVAHATDGCGGGNCGITSCDPGFADCDRALMDGCETAISSDVNNCGGCNVRCGPGQSCVGGVCRGGGCGVCPAGSSCCGTTCVNTTSDPNNCGACGRACAAGQSCAGGMCVATTCPGVPCPMGSVCCGGVCTPDQSDANNCGACAVRCGPGQVCRMGACCDPTSGVCSGMVCPGIEMNCGGMCFDTNTDPNNCGACFVRCAAGQTCSGGHCVCGCAPGTTCCPGGICANTQSDPMNCGACGRLCAAGQMCVAGMCVGGGCNGGPACGAGQTCCASGCATTSSDPNNCGACGMVCPPPANATAACAGGACTLGACNAGFGNCDANPTNGCETNLATSNANCGACGRACSAFSVCMGGTCVPTGCGGGPPCAPGQVCCGAACRSLNTDTNNCGMCGHVCMPQNSTATCTAGVCGHGACSAGFGDCDGNAANGCETNLGTDPNNCGMCGMGCGSGLTCTAGMCQPPSTGSEGAFDPTVNPTYLTPGVHNFTTITVPAGVVVYVAGVGAQSGTLDLRATGHIQIDGTIDVSGGPGTQAIIASSSTQLGKGGTGGYTGQVQSSPYATMNCEFSTGAPGPNGPMVMGSAGTCSVLANTACITRMDPMSFLFTAPLAQYGGGAGVFTGYRAYGSGGGGYAGGAPGALGAPYPREADCMGASGGGGATAGNGGSAGVPVYNGANGVLGQTQCAGLMGGVPAAYVGGGGGGSIGTAAAGDLPARTTFYPGSGGGGGSADYLQRPAFGGTSGGGGGGGALRLWTTADISVTGQLLANGGTGGDAYIGTPAGAMCDPQPGAAGGGGSGGLIYLDAPTVNVSAGATVSAHGGAGGAGSVFATGGAGGAGGLGRIRVSATTTTCTLGGSFNPPLVAGCAPTAVPTAGRTYVGVYPN